jgi:hypothetical protein
MALLKNLPIRYTGELHHVHLINFSVDKKEVESLVPWKIRLRDYKGRALISMVNVQLRHMHPTFLPAAIRFNYRHIGFRLLVEDAHYNNGRNQGIYFLKSFTDSPIIAQGGRWLTSYNLETADLVATPQLLALKHKEQSLTYVLDEEVPVRKDAYLYEQVSQIDRAYSVSNNTVYKTRIIREQWPIEWIGCDYFQTSFFETARLEGAFRVREKIDYQWLPAQKVP